MGGMRSGIPDFDNMQSRSYQFDHPDTDLGPVDEIGFLSLPVDFDCTPGTCGEYSSTNYELLGSFWRSKQAQLRGTSTRRPLTSERYCRKCPTRHLQCMAIAASIPTCMATAVRCSHLLTSTTSPARTAGHVGT